MLEIRKSQERGSYNYGWLDTKHTFSFSEYYDVKFMGYGPLKVINEDKLIVGAGFAEHFHKDMEIVTYVISGALRHKDSMGNESVIRPGEIQVLSAGTGVRHSEYNDSSKEIAHVLQIWITPEEESLAPFYDQKTFSTSIGCSDVSLVASGSGRENTARINQDVDIYVGNAQSDGIKTLKTFKYRKTWVQVIRGEVSVSGSKLRPGDGVGVSDKDVVEISWKKGAEFLIFDLP